MARKIGSACPVHLVYGPYEDLPGPGKYRAVFKLKTDDNLNPRDVVHIDAYSNSNGSLNSPRSIRGIHFDGPDQYQLFSVTFAYGGEKDVEYRVIKLSQANHLWIDYVAILKESV